MTPNEYQKLAMRTEAPAQPILDRLARLGVRGMRLDNAARGLAGDAGEVSTCIQRHIEYQQPLDETHLLEEIGDCLWRLAQLLDAMGSTMEAAMRANLSKLKASYPERYSDAHAAEENRDRAAERRALEANQ